MKNFLLSVIALLPLVPVAQPWQIMADVPADFVFPVAVELRGNIHVLGGGIAGTATNLHVRYTPATNTWDTLAPVPYLAQQPAGAVVNEKIHYCGGGYPTSGQRLNHHYYYDPDSNAWFQAASLPVAVAIHECASADGKLFVLSGQPDKALCEYYDPDSDAWYQRNPLPDNNFWYGAIVSANNTIYRFGGGGYTAPSARASLYDRQNDIWTGLPSLPVAVHAIAGTNMGDTLICLSGGYANGTELDSVWIFDINAQTYTQIDTLPIACDYHSMASAQGCVYSIGGNNNTFPQVGVSLLKNSTAAFLLNVPSDKNQLQKPYSSVITKSFLELHLNADAKHAAIKLLDMHGRILLVQSFDKNDGSILLSNEKISSGMYLVLISIGGNTYTEQWMVVK